MADIHELIEQIKVTLASSRTPSKDQLRDLHNELTDQIRRANKRLRECDGLIAKGLRTEAIQLAEQEPPLLDLVAILDFPELPEWNDFVAELGLSVAPDLQMEIAADLNRAYSDDSPLEQLMRKFRLSALSRAPLKQRIGLLRKIAKLDAGNSIWESDLKNYEEVRQRQIKDQIQSASRSKDFDTLRDIATELHSKWLTPPPKQLVARVDQEVKALQALVAQKRMRRLADDLLDAQDDKDIDRAAELQEEWESVVKLCGASDEARQLQRQVRPVLAWLADERKRSEDQDRFRDAVERLQRSIEGGHDMPELERRYAAATRFSGFELSEDVQDAFDAAVLNHKRKKQLRLIIMAFSIVAVVLIAGILFVVFNRPSQS